MMKRKQVRGLTQTRDWDEKTHISKYPSNASNNDRDLKQAFHQKNISTFEG
jgi:hypothetical protein